MTEPNTPKLAAQHPKLPPDLNWTPVSSSNIARVAHDLANQHLYVDFSRSADKTKQLPVNVYRYDGVTAEQHQAVLGAKSVGQHFHTEIKSRRLPLKDKQVDGDYAHPATKVAT